MERDKIQAVLRQQPFQPFRVHLTDGRTFTIHFPRMTLLGETFIKIGVFVPKIEVFDPKAPEPTCDYTEFVRLQLIDRLEMLSSPSVAS